MKTYYISPQEEYYHTLACYLAGEPGHRAISEEELKTARTGKGVPYRPHRCLADPSNLFTRASGSIICEDCRKPYRKHPMASEHLDFTGSPWLNRLCDGRLVKL